MSVRARTTSLPALCERSVYTLRWNRDLAERRAALSPRTPPFPVYTRAQLAALWSPRAALLAAPRSVPLRLPPSLLRVARSAPRPPGLLSLGYGCLTARAPSLRARTGPRRLHAASSAPPPQPPLSPHLPRLATWLSSSPLVARRAASRPTHAIGCTAGGGRRCLLCRPHAMHIGRVLPVYYFGGEGRGPPARAARPPARPLS